MKQRFLYFFDWVSKQKYAYFLLLPILLLISFYSCRNEVAESTPYNSISKEGIISMSYEVEELHYKKFDETNSTLSDLDKIAQIPSVTREKIQLAIFDDGSFERTSEKIEPQIIKLQAPNHQTPPDKVPRSVLTKVDRIGISHFYDKNNNELYSLKLTNPQSFKSIVESVKAGLLTKEALVNIILGLSTYGNLDSLINSAKNNGDNVTQLGDGISLVTHIASSVSLNSNVKFRTPHNFKTETILDIKNKIILGARTSNESGNEVFQIIPRYSLDAKGKPQVDLVHKELTDYDHPSKKVIKSISESYYANLNSQINFH